MLDAEQPDIVDVIFFTYLAQSLQSVQGLSSAGSLNAVSGSVVSYESFLRHLSLYVLLQYIRGHGVFSIKTWHKTSS